MSKPRVVSNNPHLVRPAGDPIRLNNKDFVAIDRDRDATYEATYRPQALYNRANEGFHANNEAFLLHEVSTICRSTAPIPAPPISIFTFRRAVSSSCWSRRACSPSITMADFSTSALAR